MLRLFVVSVAFVPPEIEVGRVADFESSPVFCSWWFFVQLRGSWIEDLRGSRHCGWCFSSFFFCFFPLAADESVRGSLALLPAMAFYKFR